MVLYKLYVFCSDMKFNIAATAGLSLTMDRFVSALVGIPEIKAKLIEHIVPSLENRIAEVIQPLKQDTIQLGRQNYRN